MTGGKNATSSPSLTGWEWGTYSRFTAINILSGIIVVPLTWAQTSATVWQAAGSTRSSSRPIRPNAALSVDRARVVIRDTGRDDARVSRSYDLVTAAHRPARIPAEALGGWCLLRSSKPSRSRGMPRDRWVRFPCASATYFNNLRLLCCPTLELESRACQEAMPPSVPPFPSCPPRRSNA